LRDHFEAGEREGEREGREGKEMKERDGRKHPRHKFLVTA